jgi:uncharacterized protein (TIGR04255 family)
MTTTSDFANPPIVELVLGAQFFPLSKLTAGHYGLFWKELQDDWTEPGEGPGIEDRFELFDRPITPTNVQMRMEPFRLPGRFTLGHRNKDRLLQIQPTRFHLNWQKREGFYPSYRRLIAEFEDMFARFRSFTQRMGLGELAVNQWELTYVDAFPKKEYWTAPADWTTFLPGLFGQLFPTDGLDLALEHRAAEWSYEIQPKRGRLHIAAGPSRVGALILQMTARGPVGESGAETLRAGLDVGHAAASGTFLRVASEEAKKRWGPKP